MIVRRACGRLAGSSPTGGALEALLEFSILRPVTTVSHLSAWKIWWRLTCDLAWWDDVSPELRQVIDRTSTLNSSDPQSDNLESIRSYEHEHDTKPRPDVRTFLWRIFVPGRVITARGSGARGRRGVARVRQGAPGDSGVCPAHGAHIRRQRHVAQ